MLNSASCYQQSQELTHGIANRDLGLKRMVKIPVFRPPLEQQSAFARLIRNIKSIQLQQTTATAKAEATFDALLAQTFSHRQQERVETITERGAVA